MEEVMNLHPYLQIWVSQQNQNPVTDEIILQCHHKCVELIFSLSSSKALYNHLPVTLQWGKDTHSFQGSLDTQTKSTKASLQSWDFSIIYFF